MITATILVLLYLAIALPGFSILIFYGLFIKWIGERERRKAIRHYPGKHRRDLVATTKIVVGFVTFPAMTGFLSVLVFWLQYSENDMMTPGLGYILCMCIWPLYCYFCVRLGDGIVARYTAFCLNFRSFFHTKNTQKIRKNRLNV